MKKIKVQVFNAGENELPHYATEFASGMDVKANIPVDEFNGRREVTICSNERKLIKTGLFIAIPEGYEVQVRPRSGLALKLGVSVLNTPGTIDSDYRGEVGVIIINHDIHPFVIQHGDRIAQLVIKETNQIEFEEVQTFDDLPTSDRGTGGFGSTGK